MKDYNEVAQSVLERRDKYVAERRRATKRIVSTLSCFCLVALVGFVAWHSGLFDSQPAFNEPMNEPQEVEFQDGTAASVTEGSDMTVDPELPVDLVLPVAHFNVVDKPDPATYQQIALPGEDYISMTYVELLSYYGIELPIEEAFPDLSLADSERGYGVYQNSERGAYYDGNSVRFENADGTQTLHITLTKAFHHPYDIFTLTGEQIGFTSVNGHDLSVFSYVDENGAQRFYVELLQNDVGWYVDASGVSEDDFLRILMTVVTETPDDDADANNVLYGAVHSVDSYANRIGVRPDGENLVYTVTLPPDISADDYSMDDQVIITYEGEPATIKTIWPQQLVSVAFAEP